jgi:hypothetical protein
MVFRVIKTTLRRDATDKDLNALFLHESQQGTWQETLMADLRLHNSQRTAVMDSTFGIALSPWTAELGLGAKKAPSRDDHRSTNIHVIISSIEHLLPNMGALRWDTPPEPHIGYLNIIEPYVALAITFNSVSYRLTRRLLRVHRTTKI